MEGKLSANNHGRWTLMMIYGKPLLWSSVLESTGEEWPVVWLGKVDVKMRPEAPVWFPQKHQPSQTHSSPVMKDFSQLIFSHVQLVEAEPLNVFSENPSVDSQFVLMSSVDWSHQLMLPLDVVWHQIILNIRKNRCLLHSKIDVNVAFNRRHHSCTRMHTQIHVHTARLETEGGLCEVHSSVTVVTPLYLWDGVWACALVLVSVLNLLYVLVHVCVHVCMCACVCVHSWDKNKLRFGHFYIYWTETGNGGGFKPWSAAVRLPSVYGPRAERAHATKAYFLGFDRKLQSVNVRQKYRSSLCCKYKALSCELQDKRLLFAPKFWGVLFGGSAEWILKS